MKPVTPHPLSKRPRIVLWEATRACALACSHCRIRTEVTGRSNELDTLEAERLIEQVRLAAPELFIITGGDPMMRDDIVSLINRARWAGLRVELNPSVTPLLLKTDFKALVKAGVKQIALSLDGATREAHDTFRGVPGTWDRTLEAIAMAHHANLPIEINTMLTRRNLAQFEQFPGVISLMRPAAWTVFLLVPIGRNPIEDVPTAEEVEAVFNRLYDVSLSSKFSVNTVEGLHYQRVVWQRTHPRKSTTCPPPDTRDRQGRVFISSRGEICPSGFLPEMAGDIRTDNLLEIYQEHPVFEHLRNPNALRGKCGRCPYNVVCGGSRSRAYAMTGDPFEPDPLCSYEPPVKSELMS